MEQEKMLLGECQLWPLSRNRDGYGQMNWNGRSTGVHRLVWEWWNRKAVPKGWAVRHLCDNPSCVNPLHLRLGTYGDNSRDAVIRNRIGRRPGVKNDLERMDRIVAAYVAGGRIQEIADREGVLPANVLLLARSAGVWIRHGERKRLRQTDPFDGFNPLIGGKGQ